VAEDGTKSRSWLRRLKSGLSRTSGSLTSGIASLLTKSKLDDATIEDLEDLLIQADLGLETTRRITQRIAKERYDKAISSEEVRAVIADEIAGVLAPLTKPLAPDPSHKPHVILMVGVNGTGKTTTIGKLAHDFRAAGKSVMLAAGDTFRAAAIEQLQVWGERVGAEVVTTKVGGDPAGLAYDALSRAHAAGIDVLLIDTAGRLQNKAHLMEELAKVVRVVRKLEPGAPHDTVLVLDATTGQNALGQVATFREVADITGLIMTKLDGTARGGILVACAERFGLAIHAIGVGEGIDDLQPFDATSFARAIAGLDGAPETP
jgi:fused signal recognition particle receptor